MSSKHWRYQSSNYAADSLCGDVAFEALNNADACSSCADDGNNILIWLDASINKEHRDDQYSIRQLRSLINSVIIFTNADDCLRFIETFRQKNKLFVMVSGSLGQHFLPKINYSSQIYSIYIFCGRKLYHESWAAKYEKIEGVFDDITNLCEYLKRDKQILEQERVYRKCRNDYPINSYEFSNSIKAEHNGYQADDYIQRAVTSEDVPLSREEISSPIESVASNNRIESSETVTTFIEYKQPLAVSDTGIWPRVSVIDSSSITETVRHLQSTIGVVQYSSSIETCLHYVDENPGDPHFVVLSNPTDIEDLPTLFSRCVRKVYIHCSCDRFGELTARTEKYSNIVSVLQHTDTLTRLILWDLSVCIVNIANHYESKHQKDFAEVRYQYAYHLHVIIEKDLNHRIEAIEYKRLRRLMG